MSEKVETTGEEKKFELGERARKKKKKLGRRSICWWAML